MSESKSVRVGAIGKQKSLYFVIPRRLAKYVDIKKGDNISITVQEGTNKLVLSKLVEAP